MSGIIVGIDGSGHSRRTLERAFNEAATRHVPLTVLTVRQLPFRYWGRPADYPGAEERTKRARVTVQRETDSMLQMTGAGTRPPWVTVRAVTGLPAEKLLSAAGDADMIVVGSHDVAGFKRLLIEPVSTKVSRHARCPVMVVPADEI